MSVLMSADVANFGGNAHGGRILSLLDNVAYACASRYCKRYVVTLSERNPTEVSQVELETDEEREPLADAEHRRDQRKENAARSKASNGYRT